MNDATASARAGLRIQWALCVNAGARTALQLVLSLRAGLEQRVAALDRAFDQLVVAELEVQHLVVLEAAPVAAIEMRPLLEVDRAGDGLGALIRQRRHQPVRQRRARHLEETFAQVRDAAVARDVGQVEQVQRPASRPVRARCPAAVRKRSPVRRRRLALLAHLLAVSRPERRQVVRRSSRTGVRRGCASETAWTGAAGTGAGRAGPSPPRCRTENARTETRSSSASCRTPRSSAAVTGRRVGVGVDGQPLAGDGRERVSPRPASGSSARRRAARVRPAPVEDELAVAVGLEVERHRAHQPARRRARSPGAARSRRAARRCPTPPAPPGRRARETGRRRPPAGPSPRRRRR
jgi:hypothetical protein